MTAERVRFPRTGIHLFGGKSPKALGWQPLPYMEEWLENMAAEEVSEGYINAAKVGLTHFGIFAAAEGIKHPDEITRQHILRFQTYLIDYRKENGDPLSLSYRQQLMKYIRNWVNWLLEVEHIETSPWVRIRVGRTIKKPKPLEDDEISLLFDAHKQQAFTIPPFYYHRRESILVLLYAWGLRLHELQALTVVNMDVRLEYVTVRNKSRQGGNNTKSMPYSSEMKQVLTRWMMNRSKHAVAGEDALFIDSKGQPLSAHMLRKIVVECGARAGITINPHRLRDSFGTTMLDHDVEVERIMKMMGHTQRAQTLAYARVNDPKVKESHHRVYDPLIQRLLKGELP